MTDGEVVFAGPRCIDLPVPPPGWSTALHRVRSHSRWRITLPHDPLQAPLGGWIFLTWGERMSISPVAPDVLLQRLAARRLRTELPSNPATLLGLATFPAWHAARELDWSHAETATDALLELLDDRPRSDTRIGGRT